MACGCGRRARAAAQGKTINGYRVTLPDGSVLPPEGESPYLSPAEARAAIRKHGGGTAWVDYGQPTP